jgi:hypothetical protein
MIDGRDFQTREEATWAIDNYIDVFYNSLDDRLREPDRV